jgi:cation transport ATPase
MPIQVTCNKCHKRFNVSEKFAGKKGPCPNCKAEITVPADSDAAVVHEPESFGAKPATGAAVFKPITRTETKFNPVLTVGLVAVALMTIFIAWMVRPDEGSVPQIMVIAGALLLAPPLVWGGYTFVRDQELAPLTGMELWIRVAICSAIYALLWGMVAYVKWYLFEDLTIEFYQMAILFAVFLAVGGVAGFVSFELEYTTGLIHFGFYLAATVLLRIIAGMSAL